MFLRASHSVENFQDLHHCISLNICIRLEIIELNTMTHSKIFQTDHLWPTSTGIVLT
jgi:hypothetical protein